MNEENRTKRKDWVKNAAIIFLSVMLVLTFFSNTIMNYSLPEVATEVVEPGSITAKIRGTGTLTSDDPYKVSIQESRVIASVAVKEGDIVEKDQVLFYLEDKESAELEAAEKELDELVLSYTTAILNGEISNQSYQNIQSGNISSTGDYQARIEAAKQKVANAQAMVDSLANQIAIAGTTTSSEIDKKAELAKAEAALADAEARRSTAQSNLQAAQAKYDGMGAETELTAAKNEAAKKEEDAKKEFDDSINTADTGLQALLDKVNAAYPDANLQIQEYTNQSKDAYMQILNNLEASIGTVSENDTLTSSAIAQLGEVKKAFESYYAAKAVRETAEKTLNEKINLSPEIARLTQESKNAEAYYNQCQTRCNNLKNEITNNQTGNDKQKADLEIQKINADAALAQAKEEQAQLLTDISTELNLGNQNSIIREKREEIAKLREKAVGATVVAPVAGVVTNVYKTAGETTVPDEELVVMQPEGKGYSLSFSVTADQAKKVNVGEIAEIQNSWYYDNITATIASIRPDPENPGQNKLLVFNVEGDVQAGQTLSLSVGQKSANYDLLVPNSAVREDNNGKFILIVESKNSPLGNRYIATRVDVEVLGSDDVKTAISALLDGYEYVITTATQPVEAGQQVRLAES